MCAGGGCQAPGAAGRVVKVAPVPKFTSATEAKPCSPNKSHPKTSCLVLHPSFRMGMAELLRPRLAANKPRPEIQGGYGYCLSRQILLALLG